MCLLGAKGFLVTPKRALNCLDYGFSTLLGLLPNASPGRPGSGALHDGPT